MRGAGLMRGVELRVDATPVVDLARERGLLVNRTNEKVVRLLPPLTIDAAEIDAGIDILDAVSGGSRRRGARMSTRQLIAIQNDEVPVGIALGRRRRARRRRRVDRACRD